MGWTILAPKYDGVVPTKTFHNCREVSNFAFSEAVFSTEQPLQCEEQLSLEALRDVILEVNHEQLPAFLMRGGPTSYTNGTIGLSNAYWVDAASKQHQWDLDFTNVLIHQNSLLDERVEDVVLEAFPFMKGKKFLAQLSSGAGLPSIIKANGEIKDYPHRVNLRVWIETTRAYTGAELYEKYRHLDGLVDLAMFQPNRRHYILKPVLTNTPNELENEEWLRLYDGEILDLEATFGAGEPPVASKRSHLPAVKPSPAPFEDNMPGIEMSQVKQVIFSTHRDYVVSALEKLGTTKSFRGQRNEILRLLFNREALFNRGNCGQLIEDILNTTHLRGDRSEANLVAWEKSQSEAVLKKLRSDALSFAVGKFEKIEVFSEIDLANKNWSGLRDHRFVAIKSDCGTNKTKGVIYEEVRQAKANVETLLIITPLVANTIQIAEEVGIKHYHSYGTARKEKLHAVNTSRHLALCYQSLGLYSEPPEIDTLIIDEASLVWRGWDGAEEWADELQMLFEIADKAKRVIITCADIDKHTLWCLSQIENFAAEEAALYLNSASYGKGYQINLTPDYWGTIQKIVESLTAGKRSAVVIDLKEDFGALSALAAAISEASGSKKIKAFDSKTVRAAAPELRSRPNATISAWMENNELDCLVLSPWCAAGWDYLDTASIFDEVFVISKNNFLPANKLWQSLRRFRLTRQATVCIPDWHSPPFQNELLKIVQTEKNVAYNELTRAERYAIETHNAHSLDKADIAWSFRGLCIERGARVEDVETFNYSQQERDDLETAVKSWRDKYKEAAQSRLLNDAEKNEEVASQFLIWRGDKYERIISAETLQDKTLASLHNRVEKIDAKAAERFSRLFYLDKEERALEEDGLTRFNEVLGRLFDAFWFCIGELVDTKQFWAFPHWYCRNNPDAAIYGDFDDLNLKELQTVLARNFSTLKLELPRLGRDCINEPARVIGPVVRAFGLVFTTKNEWQVEQGERPRRATEIKRDLKATYSKEYASVFPKLKNETERIAFYLEKIRLKQQKGTPLSDLEVEYFMSRPRAFRIKQRAIQAKVWVEKMEVAALSLDDRELGTQNHSRFCNCIDCRGEIDLLKENQFSQKN